MATDTISAFRDVGEYDIKIKRDRQMPPALRPRRPSRLLPRRLQPRRQSDGADGGLAQSRGLSAA